MRRLVAVRTMLGQGEQGSSAATCTQEKAVAQFLSELRSLPLYQVPSSFLALCNMRWYGYVGKGSEGGVGAQAVAAVVKDAPASGPYRATTCASAPLV